MIPDPALTFTIPSVHDGTALDCRIYHPAALDARPHSLPWLRHAAIIAHPYAPLGGCYDDPIVEAVAARLLRNGFLIGTFNFRGGGNSAGRTSWTSRPEQGDYKSFIAFLVYYIHHLDPFQEEHITPGCPHDRSNLPPSSSSKVDSVVSETIAGRAPVLLLGGYSYGSMVAMQLPPLDDVLLPFSSPNAGSNAAQIRLSAESLASRETEILRDVRNAYLEHRKQGSPRKGYVRMGGGDGGASPRRSYEGGGKRRLSIEVEEKFRRGLGEIMSATGHVRHGRRSLATARAQTSEPNAETEKSGVLTAVSGLVVPRAAYLLVSPLQGLVSHLATFSLMPSALSRPLDTEGLVAERKLCFQPTFAVYGDSDGFTSAARLRTWAQRLQQQPQSRFRAGEIATAGHFWVEEGVLAQMLGLIDDFSDMLLDSSK